MKNFKMIAATLTAAMMATAGAAYAQNSSSGAQSSDYAGSHTPGTGTGPGKGVGPGPNTGGGGAMNNNTSGAGTTAKMQNMQKGDTASPKSGPPQSADYNGSRSAGTGTGPGKGVGAGPNTGAGGSQGNNPGSTATGK